MIDWKATYADMRRMQNEALQAQIAGVWHRSRFYQDVWGSDPAGTPFDELPMVAKDDIHRALEAGNHPQQG